MERNRSGSDKEALNPERRRMSRIGIGFYCCENIHGLEGHAAIGQVPGPICTICGCIGRCSAQSSNEALAGASARNGGSPHVLAATNGCSMPAVPGAAIKFSGLFANCSRTGPNKSSKPYLVPTLPADLRSTVIAQTGSSHLWWWKNEHEGKAYYFVRPGRGAIRE